MKVLVTGAGGFLGEYLTKLLLTNGHEVLGLVHSPNKDIKPEIKYIKFDITSENHYKKLKNHCFDTVIHNAAYVDFNDTLESFDHFINVNVRGTLNILDFCIENGVSNIIYSSSVSVYENTIGCLSENHECNPKSFYGMSKLMGELLCQKYQSETDLNCCILRYGGIYGYGARHNISIMNFINSIIDKQEINLFNENSQRNYLYVKDAAFANLFALENHLKGKYNIVSNENLKLLEMVDIISDIFDDYSPKINYSNDNIENNVLYDPKKFINICKEFPKYSFEESINDIKKRIDDFEEA